jgi:hypothetical protein
MVMVNSSLYILRRTINILLLCLVSIIDFSCKDEPPYVYVCKNGLLEYKEVNNLFFSENMTQTDTLITLVIRSQAQFEKYFSPGSNTFDFEKNTLLAGRYLALNLDRVESQTVKSYCEYNVLFYDVQLTGRVIPAYSKVPFFALIPKIPDSTSVQFSVHY